MPIPVLVSNTRRLIGAPADPTLLNLIPNPQILTHGGKQLVIVPHGIDETIFLRNMGYDVPAPASYQYDYEGALTGDKPPFLVQRRTVEMLTCNVRAYVLNGMGTGKTKAALWAWRFLRRQGRAGKLLVVAPLSTLNFTWGREIFETLPNIKSQTLHGSRQKRLDRLADPEADIYIINHDGVGVLFPELYGRGDIDALVLDELAVYRNGGAKRSKLMAKLAARMKWVWGMTGSPTPTAPTDAWGEARVVTPATVPKYFKHFRDRVMTQVSQFRYVPRPDALNHVFGVLQPSVRYSLDDVTELPPLVIRQVDVAMGPNQAKAYAAMEKEAFAAIKAEEITAMNAGAVLNKLLQISTGWVYTRDHRTVELDNDARLNQLRDDVLASEKKVLVFVPFTHALDGIAGFLRAEGIDVATVSGETPQGQRLSLFNAFQNTPQVHTLVAHPQCMAHGLTLTAASVIIWYAPTTSLEIFDQANARIRRIGQDTRQLILLYQSTRAEKKMYAKLRSQQQVQNTLLDMFEEQTGL